MAVFLFIFHVDTHPRHSCAHLVECKCIPDNHFSILNDRNRGTQMLIKIFRPKIFREDEARNTYVCPHICLWLFTKANMQTRLTFEDQQQALCDLIESNDFPMGPRGCDGLHLRGADETTLVFTPVHTQHLVSMTLQDTLGLYWQLTHHFHLLSHLVHWGTHAHTHTEI